MAKDQIKSDPDQMFHAAEQTGLKLAIKGRLIALLLVGLWLVPSRGADRAADIVTALLVLAGLGIIHFLVIGSVWDRKWVKYVFFGIDTLLLSIAIVTLPPEPAVALPQIFMFKFDVFLYYFIILGVAAFSFSPGLVLWVGALGAGGWLAAFAWVRAGMAAPLEWRDALQGGSKEQFLAVFLNENFAATGSRIQESLVYLVVAILIAIVMYRARQTVHRQLEAERDKATVSQIFGRYVPETIANTLISDRGLLEPVEGTATVLFVDVAGFTKMTEANGPRRVVGVLNAFFDRATAIINRYDGVVTQFIGDAIMATFNLPVEDPEHAAKAICTALDIIDLAANETFDGKRLGVRAGIATGPVIAGSVGGGGRQTYSLYGDTVNLSARLEVLNKEHGTQLLVDAITLDSLPGIPMRQIGSIEVRGFSEPAAVFTPIAETSKELRLRLGRTD